MASLGTAYLQRIFIKLDKNGDGLVSVDELISLLDMIGFPGRRDELEVMVGDEGLDYADFVFFYESLMKGYVFEQEKSSGGGDENFERDLRKAFEVFDLNGDGFISCEELQIALSRLGLLDECGGDCRHMIDVYDTNSDGMVDFEEFKNMMLLTGQS